MLHSRIFTFNPLGTNCVVLWADGSKTCTVTDPGMSSPDGLNQLVSFLKEHDLVPDAILLTHGHFDHVWGMDRLLSCWKVPVYLHPDDRDIMDRVASSFREMSSLVKHDFESIDIAEGEVLSTGGTDWTILHTPGHSPGSVCYYSAKDKLLLSGDTLFAGSIGRTDLSGGDYDQLMQSIQAKLLALPGETDVIPGHGQPTTIAREGMYNPFLQPFNEPDGDFPQEGIPIQRI